MERQCLEDLGLPDEAIDKIAALAARDIQTVSAQYEARLLRSAVDSALFREGARDPRTVIPLIDLESVRLENGALSGLEPQLEAVRRQSPFLFAAQMPQVDSGLAHGSPPGPPAPATLRDALNQYYR